MQNNKPHSVESSVRQPETFKEAETKVNSLEVTRKKCIQRLRQMHQTIDVCENKFINAGIRQNNS